MKETFYPLGKSFALITKAYIGAISSRLSHLDIERHFYLLYRIGTATEPLTQKDLGEIINQDKSAMVRIIDYLSDFGYVRRKQNPQDRREYFIVLTTKGEEVIPEIKSAFSFVDDAALQSLNKEDRAYLDKVLQSVYENLNQLPAQDVKLDYKKSSLSSSNS